MRLAGRTWASALTAIALTAAAAVPAAARTAPMIPPDGGSVQPGTLIKLPCKELTESEMHTPGNHFPGDEFNEHGDTRTEEYAKSSLSGPVTGEAGIRPCEPQTVEVDEEGEYTWYFMHARRVDRFECDEHPKPCHIESSRYGWGSWEYDEGESFLHSESRTFTVEGSYRRFTDREKQRYGKAATRFGGGAAVIGIAGAFAGGPCPPCGVALGVAGGLYGLAGWYYGELAADPPDKNFRTVVKPRTPRFPAIKPGGALTAAAVKALLPMMRKQAETIGLQKALLTSIERAGGARDAKQRKHEKRQMKAVAAYAKRLAGVIGQEMKLRTAARRALERTRFPAVQATPELFKSYQAQVAKGNLGPGVADALAKLGAEPRAVTTIKGDIMLLDPKDVRGSFPALLTDGALMQSMRQTAADLRALARRASK